MQISTSGNRITGLASGMDTDSLVKQMMSGYQTQLDKLQQDETLTEWRQQAYRDLISGVNSLQSTYFDSLKPDKYLLSPNSLSSNKASSIADGTVSVTAGSSAKAGNYTINVSQLAQAAEIQGNTPLNTVLAGTSNENIKIDASNNTFTVNGTTFSIPVDATAGYNKYTSVNQVATAMNNSIAGSALNNKVKAVVDSTSNSIKFMQLTNIVEDKTTPANSNNKITLNYGGKDYAVTIAAGNYTADELSAKITSQLSGLKSVDGTATLPAGVTLAATTGANSGDQTTFALKDSNGGTLGSVASLTDGKGSAIQFTTTTASGTASASTGTDATISNNSVAYSNEIITGFNDTINVRVGTKTYTGTIAAGTYSTDASLETALKSALSGAKLSTDPTQTLSSSDLDVNVVNGRIKFTSTSGSQVSIYGNASSVFGANDNFDVSMNGSGNFSNLSQFSGQTVKFKINNKEFTYDFSTNYDATTNPNGAKNRSISQILGDISSATGTKVSYSDITKKFTIDSANMGASESLSIQDETGSFLNTLFGTSNKTVTGQDAQISLTTPDGTTTYSKSTNVFTAGGLSLTLNSTTTTPETFSVTANTDDAFNKIKNFVTDYNALISTVNTKLTEKYDRDYPPLTDAQKSSMKDSDITNWENKAKTGLVRGDSDLTNMLYQFRDAMFSKVQGSGLSLSDIGIDTSDDYTQGGKLVLDEDKLRNALQTQGDKVSQLFSQQSTSYPTYTIDSSTARKTRYNEEGIFQRINDVIKDYTRTTNGKGTLLLKAGVTGDTTETQNTLSQSISKQKDAIAAFKEKMNDKQTFYYNEFSQMETALNNLNSQSGMLASLSGSSS